MHRMTVGMVETARRKTRFPTVGTTIHAKAKPPSAHGFLYLFHHPHRRNTQRGEHVIAPPQAAATPNRRSPAQRSASRKGNGVAFPQPQFGDQDTTISNYPMINNEKIMEVRTICVKLYA